jgi:hypothetical protein
MTIFIAVIVTILSYYQPEKPLITFNPSNDSSQLWKNCKLEGIIPLNLFNMAMAGYRQIGNLNDKQIIIIIDYSKPSTEKRFYVINLKQKMEI